MVAVCDAWAEQFYSKYFAACQPPATEWNTAEARIFIPLPRREWQKAVVGYFADDDHVPICTKRKIGAVVLLPESCAT